MRRIDNEEEALGLLLQSHANGEASVWIRNTVHDAVSAYRLVQSHIGRDVDLFHARFALGDRMQREEAALATFGKGDMGRFCLSAGTRRATAVWRSISSTMCCGPL